MHTQLVDMGISMDVTHNDAMDYKNGGVRNGVSQ